jgi:molybdopterin molybdotransferase
LGRGHIGSHHDHDVFGEGFKHLTLTSEALEAVIERLTKSVLGYEKVPVSSALGRILSHDLTSHTDIPRFIRAAMDGFAVRADDTYGAINGICSVLRIWHRV